ncbi:MAG: TetR family transcriptional regulator C-terminal domain-containing protein [Bacteroidota bacterium]
MDPQTISAAYTTFVLEHGKRPISVFAFMKALDAPETDFYAHFSSFSGLEQNIFKGFLEEAVTSLVKSPEYKTYGTPEKLAGLLFTWIQVMTPQRSFVKFLSENATYPFLSLEAEYLQSTREPFQAYVRKVIKGGVESGEVADRIFITKYYKNAFWGQARFVLNYWLNDDSNGFERTDAAIEKSLRFFYDIIQPNALDSGFDLFRFLVMKQ